MKAFHACIICAAILCLSCNGENIRIPESKIEHMRINFTEYAKAIDSTYAIDSFIFIRIDTLTEQDRLFEKSSVILRQAEEQSAKNSLAIERVKSNYRQAALARGISDVLYNNYKSEADDEAKKVRIDLDKVDEWSRLSDSLSKLAMGADSIKPVAYQGVNFFQVRSKDKSVIRDTFRVVLNLNMDIIKKEDLLK